MSDERAGDKPLPLGHLYKGYIAARHLDHCVHQAADQPQDCGQPRSAHEPPAAPKSALGGCDCDCHRHGDGRRVCCDPLPPAQPNAPAPEPPDRLREIAKQVHSKILGCYDRHPFMCDDCEEIHAALVRVVRETASEVHREAPGLSWTVPVILRHWGLEEKP